MTQQEAQTKQPDEMFCHNCGQVIKREARFCGHCGAPVATGAVSPSTAGLSEPAAPAAEFEDVVGPGRYILNFVLAGLIGLLVTYFLRQRGWLATWICLPIFVIAVIVIASL